MFVFSIVIYCINIVIVSTDATILVDGSNINWFTYTLKGSQVDHTILHCVFHSLSLDTPGQHDVKISVY